MSCVCPICGYNQVEEPNYDKENSPIGEPCPWAKTEA